jgi:hypothetical protein
MREERCAHALINSKRGKTGRQDTIETKEAVAVKLHTQNLTVRFQF